MYIPEVQQSSCQCSNAGAVTAQDADIATLAVAVRRAVSPAVFAQMHGLTRAPWPAGLHCHTWTGPCAWPGHHPTRLLHAPQTIHKPAAAIQKLCLDPESGIFRQLRNILT